MKLLIPKYRIGGYASFEPLSTTMGDGDFYFTEPTTSSSTTSSSTTSSTIPSTYTFTTSAKPSMPVRITPEFMEYFNNFKKEFGIDKLVAEAEARIKSANPNTSSSVTPVALSTPANTSVSTSKSTSDNTSVLPRSFGAILSKPDELEDVADFLRWAIRNYGLDDNVKKMIKAKGADNVFGKATSKVWDEYGDLYLLLKLNSPKKLKTKQEKTRKSDYVLTTNDEIKKLRLKQISDLGYDGDMSIFENMTSQELNRFIVAYQEQLKNNHIRQREEQKYKAYGHRPFSSMSEEQKKKLYNRKVNINNDLEKAAAYAMAIALMGPGAVDLMASIGEIKTAKQIYDIVKNSKNPNAVWEQEALESQAVLDGWRNYATSASKRLMDKYVYQGL